MSDTPTFANLLTQWTGGPTTARAAVYAHLRNNPAEAAALEVPIRDELNSALAWKCGIAAEAMVEVYGDEPAAATALGRVLRHSDSIAASDLVPVLRKLSAERAGPLWADFAIRAPSAFRELPAEAHRWAGSTAARAGAEWWGALLGHAGAEAESALLMGLADAAPRVMCLLSALEPTVRSRLFHTGPGYAAGAALWRLTWRVHCDWLASINPHSPRFEGDAPLLVFLIEVLTEHLGRRLAAVVRELVVRLGTDNLEAFWQVVTRLANLGSRGWSVLLPILGDESAPAHTRTFVFRETATRPAVLPLAHHHAHAVVLTRNRDRTAVPVELLEAAGEALRALGASAGSALPDVLNLIVNQPDVTRHVTQIIPALAPGWPLPAVALARAIDRLRRSSVFASDGFALLAAVYAERNRDDWPALVDDTGFDPRTADALLQQSAWKNAPAEVRRKHALALADRLADPRAEVRARAADLLRHYPDQMRAVWPALVALLTGADERAVVLAVPHFRHLAPVADAVVPELTALFREPSPTYAARAVVALWRLGRMPVVADDLRAAVVTAPASAWGWEVLRGVVDRVFQAHGLLRDLSAVFAPAPQEIAARVHALLNPPELPEELAISAHVRAEPDPAGAPSVNWNGAFRCVENDAEGGLLFLALLCAHGSAGFGPQKIWLIKHQRGLAGTGLADAKVIVERALERLTATATAADRRGCVRDFFRWPHTGLPKGLTDLLDHRLSWYRWAGLELLDAWGAPDEVPALIEDRVCDRSALVRARALRMRHG
jgi:hypothetical protein